MTGRPVPDEPVTASDCEVVDTLDRYLGERLVDRFVANCMRAVSPLYDAADIAVETTQVRDTYPLIRAIDEHRLARAAKLLEETRARGLRPFAPLLLAKKSVGEAWVLFPPVIEVHAVRTYVINGHHRLLAARNHGIKKVRTVTIHRVSEPAPAKALEWRQVHVSPTPPENRFHTADRLDPDLIRPAASFFKSRYFFFPSTDHAIHWCQWFALSPGRWRWDPDKMTLASV